MKAEKWNERKKLRSIPRYREPGKEKRINRKERMKAEK